MALVVGPLFSQEARGQFGRTATFRRRRGQNVVSSYVVPSNPQTAEQVANRDLLTIAATATRRIRAGRLMFDGADESIVDYGRANTVGAEVWPNVVSRLILGASNATIAASRAAFAALSAQQQASWQTEATEAPSNFQDIARSSGTTFTAGEQLFILQRALRLAGYGDAWNAANPTPSDVSQAAN